MIVSYIFIYFKGFLGGGGIRCQHCSVVFILRLKLNIFTFSSQEPDAKRQRVDDGSGAATALTDAQAQNSAYNYNWYQVLLSSNYQHLLYVL